MLWADVTAYLKPPRWAELGKAQEEKAEVADAEGGREGGREESSGEGPDYREPCSR